MWSNANDNENSIYSFMRFSPTGKKSLLFVINFTPVERKNYTVGVADRGKYRLIMDENGKAQGELSSVKKPFNGCEYSLKVNMAPYGVRIYEFNHKIQNINKTII